MNVSRRVDLPWLQVLALAAALPFTVSLAGCQKGAAGGGSGGGGAVGELKTEQDKVLYALGNQLGTSLKPFSLTPAELDIVKSGVADAVTGAKPKVEQAEFQMKVRELYMARSKAAAEKIKESGKKFLEDQAKLPGAVKTESGMVFISEKPGSGESPVAQDRVKVNYEGKLTDGTVFDSSYKRNQPAEFPLGGVIPCWTEGLQKMKVGEKAKLVCPSAIAYGDRGSPPNIPGGSTLIFEVELLGIDKNAAMMPQMPSLGGGAAGGGGHPGMTPPPPGGGRPGMTPPGGKLQLQPPKQ